MSIPSATRTAYVNGTTADATQANTNEDNLVSSVNACAAELNASAGTSTDLHTRLATLDTTVAGKQDSATNTASDILTKIKTVDGTGSGLDADLLDGQHGSYYSDAANLTGTLAPTLLSGTPIQVAYASTTSVVTATATVAFDDTIPQIGEGTQVVSKSFTPRLATSIIKIDFQGWGTTASNGSCATSLFMNSDADALATSSVSGNGVIVPLALTFFTTASTTDARTYSIRCGGDVAVTYINANYTGSRRYGGVGIATMTITEIAA